MKHRIVAARNSFPFFYMKTIVTPHLKKLGMARKSVVHVFYLNEGWSKPCFFPALINPHDSTFWGSGNPLVDSTG